jgi:prenyltransferase/squalene oxidase-like repeat protein
MPARPPEVRPRRQARLSDSLPLVLPSLPEELVPPERISSLAALAATLPPVHCAGFECRLARGDSDVDLQQGMTRTHDEPAAAVRFLARAASEQRTSPVWDRVRRLCDDWASSGTALNEGVAELWLEVDVAPRAPSPVLADLMPSVFALLQAREGDESLAVATDFIARLLDEVEARPLRAVLARCAAACPSGAWISHIGVMLGRPVPALRMHVSGLPLNGFEAYLSEVGWPGDAAEALSLGRVLLDHGDMVVLCLDVVGDLLPRLGLECFFSQKWGVDPRWPALLAQLVDLGLSSREKAGALLRWPGVVTPAHMPAPWPEDLIVQSLVHPEDELGVVERRLSHVKLTYVPGEPVTAKAYFGFGHLWSRAVERPSPPRPVPAIRPAASIDEAIDATVGFLLRARNQGGWWRDFYDRGRPLDVDRRVTGYASDEWVTAYVADAMATAPSPLARPAARQAFELLQGRRRGTSGWGYHALLPADADSTTWVLRLADDLGVPCTERLSAARRFVEGLASPSGVATYRRADARQLEEFLRMEGPYDGWCATHTCVTAAAAAVLDPGSGLLQSLRRTQRPDGSWSGHWWDDDEYTGARAAEALTRHDEHRTAVTRQVDWAESRIGDDGAVHSASHGGASAFATALVLQAILVGSRARPLDETAQSVSRTTRWLLGQQRENGSWSPSARLRVPAPGALDPLASPETTLTYTDNEAVFTTATVLAALTLAAERQRAVVPPFE